MLKFSLRETPSLLFAVLFVLSVFISQSADGVVDTLQFHYGASVFAKMENQQFYDPNISWKNKYKDFPNDKRAAFPGSKTIFSAFTDAFHLFKFVRINSAQIGLIFGMLIFARLRWYQVLLAAALIKGAAWIGFYIFYSVILV